MLKGLFVNKTGMLAQQRRLDIAANNLANLNTTGFKKDKIYFREVLQAIAEPGEADENRVPGSTGIDFSMGTLKHTDNPLDVAIDGEGFFVVQGEEGEYFTRNGNFRIDAEGRLITQDGHSVVTDGGELQVNGSSILINEGGEIIVDGQTVGRLRIATFDDPQQLAKVGGTYFRAGDAGSNDLPAEQIRLRPGYLETSNVDPIAEMTQLIEINRQYELGQKSIKTQDETLQKLINQAGRF